ncbi:hypothetical protein LZ30DRAFT_683288 [Colletotrichum cereale]|nr:hypothetical protein LZ30DRAFT_683288 [Colletotrichum cereale]
MSICPGGGTTLTLGGVLLNAGAGFTAPSVSGLDHHPSPSDTHSNPHVNHILTVLSSRGTLAAYRSSRPVLGATGFGCGEDENEDDVAVNEAEGGRRTVETLLISSKGSHYNRRHWMGTSGDPAIRPLFSGHAYQRERVSGRGTCLELRIPPSCGYKPSLFLPSDH